MMQYSIEPRTRKYVKGYGFLSFATKYKKQLLDKGLDAKISDVSKYKFLKSKNVLREKDLLEKATIIKRFEYSLLSKELEKQTCRAKKKYQSFSKIFNHDEK